MSRAVTPVSRAAFLGTAQDYYVCTPNDDADLPRPGRAFRVLGDSGSVRVKNGAGRIVDLPNINSGFGFEGSVVKVFSSGTEATGIVILI